MTADASETIIMDGAPGRRIVCYCLGITRQDLQEEFAAAGKCSSRERIRQMVREGRCSCATANPSATCCLGDVETMVRQMQAMTAEMNVAGCTGLTDRKAREATCNHRRSA